MWNIEKADGAPQVTNKIGTKHCLFVIICVEKSSYRPMSLSQKYTAL